MMWEIKQNVDLADGRIAQLNELRVAPMAYPGNANGHIWKVSVFEHNAPASLAGATGVAYFKRYDGNTVVVPCTIVGNEISVEFASEVYAVPGPVSAVMNLTVLETSVMSVAAINFQVNPVMDGNPIDPSGEIALDVDTLIADIAAAVATIPADYSALSNDVNDLKNRVSVLEPTAISEDVGKALIAKTVSDGKVTEYEFGEAGGVDPAVIDQAVYDWLDDHPEATTTVQDGSITRVKIADGVMDFVTPEMFGAIGDGETDDTNAVQAAINTGKKVLFANKTYLISPITIAKSAELVGEEGAKIVTEEQTSALTFAPVRKNRLAMAEDYDHLDYTADSGVSRITLTSLGDVSVGDLVYIYATNQTYIPARQYYYKGCTALVTKVDTYNSAIYINFAMPFDLEADGAVVDVYEPLNVRIYNIDFESSLDLEAVVGSIGVAIWYSAFCDIAKCNFKGFTNQIVLYNSVMSNIEDCSFAYAKPDNTLHWDGYGIMVASCNVTTIKRVTANCGQHAISTGGNTPVFGTVIQDCRLFSECTTYAIGLHDNDHDCVVERSVVGGMWGCGNLTVRDVRMVCNANSASVLLTGNPGDTRTNARFNDVDFGNLYVDINAYPQGAAEAYSNDFGNIIFEDCTGGNFRVIDLSSNNMITGSNIKLIYVNHWQDCNGFTLSYGTISELNLNSLLFVLTVVNGFITSQTKRAINSPCIVLKEYNGDDAYDNLQEVQKKADAVYKNSGTLYTGSSFSDSANGSIKNLKIYGIPSDSSAARSVTLNVTSGNVFPALDGFEINIENSHINGVSGGINTRETLIPSNWKRKTFVIRCMIDNRNGDATTISSVDVHLYNSKGVEIYRGPLVGLYENSIFESKFSFVMPDEAYRMIVNARLYADGEGKTARAYDFALTMEQSLHLSVNEFGYAIPAMTVPTYIDGNGDPYVANYYDLERGLFVRELEWFRTDVIPNDALTSWNDYFDSSIVGGFIPAEIVNKSDGIGRNLSDYYSATTTILDTDTPPTDEPCVWIHDGGIGFAYYVSDVGERTMAALLAYIKTQTYNLMCRMNVPHHVYIDITQVMLYNELVSFDEGTSFTINNSLPFSLDYSEQLPSYVSEKIIEYDKRQFRLIYENTITAETGAIHVAADLANNAFSLSEVLVIFDSVVGTGTSIGGVWVNSNYQNLAKAFVSVPSLYNATAQNRTAHIQIIGGRMFGDTEASSFPSAYGQVYIYTNKNAAGLIECGAITELYIDSLNSHKFTGGTIKIYGR